ncbi:uncharacterized protein LOC135817986 isoform X2 [Sycon ciliatum]
MLAVLPPPYTATGPALALTTDQAVHNTVLYAPTPPQPATLATQHQQVQSAALEPSRLAFHSPGVASGLAATQAQRRELVTSQPIFLQHSHPSHLFLSQPPPPAAAAVASAAAVSQTGSPAAAAAAAAAATGRASTPVAASVRVLTPTQPPGGPSGSELTTMLQARVSSPSIAPSSTLTRGTQASFPLSPHGAATRISPIATATPAAAAAGWVHAGQLAFVRPEYTAMPGTAGTGGVPQRAPMDVLSPATLPHCASYAHHAQTMQTRMAPTTLHQPGRPHGNAVAVFQAGQLGQPRLPPGYMMTMPGHPGLPALVQRMHNTKRARECTKPLKEWLLKNRRKPYPTRMEKAQLRDMTGLTFNQVSMWFANARRRIKKVGIESWARAALSGEDSYMAEEDWLDQDDTKVDSEEKEDDSRVCTDQFASPASPQTSFSDITHHVDAAKVRDHQQQQDEEALARGAISFSPLPHERGAVASGNEYATGGGSSALEYHLTPRPTLLRGGADEGSSSTCFQLPGASGGAYIPDVQQHSGMANLDTPRSPHNITFVSQHAQDADLDDMRDVDRREPQQQQQQQQLGDARHAYSSIAGGNDASDQFLPRLTSNPVADKPKNMYFYSQSQETNTMTSMPMSAQAPIPATAGGGQPLPPVPSLSSPPPALFPTATYYGLPPVSVMPSSYVVPQQPCTLTGTTASASSTYLTDSSHRS